MSEDRPYDIRVVKKAKRRPSVLDVEFNKE
jgi:hypothetical protein